MQKIVKKIFSAPSIKLNTLVVIEVVMLLLVSLGGLFYFTRKTLVEEAKKDAEQRLEGTVQHVDNILLSIEQMAGNFYYELLEHLDQPERMATYARRLVECNPNITGCAIAFEPNYFPGREQFITYVHRKKYNSPELIAADKSVNRPYTNQNWYVETMRTGRPAWLNPEQNRDYTLEPVISFCLPIRDSHGERVGVLAVGLSVTLLSQIVLDVAPTPHSYSVLLAADRSYIVHPVREKLRGEKTKVEIGRGSGEVSFEQDGETWYAFYKPFVRNNVPGRSMEALNWTIATVYPKSDIFGEYNHLVLHVLGMTFIGLFVFYVLCRMVIRRQVKPLSYLTVSAERIAEGHYEEPIPDTNRNDEVGIFQRHFQQMQKALAADISKKQQLQDALNERREKLQNTHRQIQEDDQVKAIFLHNVTNRMIPPSQSILDSVTKLCDNYPTMTLQEAGQEIDSIKRQGEIILALLSHKFEAGKGGSHE